MEDLVPAVFLILWIGLIGTIIYLFYLAYMKCKDNLFYLIEIKEVRFCLVFVFCLISWNCIQPAIKVNHEIPKNCSLEHKVLHHSF